MCCLLAFAQVVSAQQAVTSPGQRGTFDLAPLPLNVTADGMSLAQNDAAIEQSRLYQQANAPTGVGVDANGTAVAEVEPNEANDDDSFGAQKILKIQEKVRTFVITGGASVIYTSNVALTRRDVKDDFFAVGNVGANWSPRLSKNVEANLGAHASIFRYNETPALDFESLGLGLGLAWSPAAWRGANLFARYDFTELLGRDGDHILTDHALTAGLQKTFALGRSHSFSIGASGTLGLADPGVAQRSQIGAFLGYHVNLTRKLEADFLYRPAVHFYTETNRADANQILSWNLRYRFTDWAEVNASFSYGANRSDHSVFDYNVVTTGLGIGAAIRF